MDLSDAVIADIRQALLDHCVIFFRDQEIDTKQHKRLARRFGEIFVHPNFNTGDHDPEVVTIHRKPTDEIIVGEDWHTDTTMMAEPPMGALLYALEVPTHGGDTLFANQYLAYETLSDGMKKLVSRMNCVHTDRKVAGPNSRVARHKRSTAVRLDEEWRETRNVHPVVRTHPETGRKCLYIGRWAVEIEGLPFDEGRDLINELTSHISKPEFTYVHKWQPGDVVLWDNRCTQHCAIPYDDSVEERYMLRTTLEGDVPFYMTADQRKIKSSLVQ